MEQKEEGKKDKMAKENLGCRQKQTSKMKRMTKHKQTKKLKQKIKTKLMLCALCADLPTPQPASGNMTSATQKQ